MAKSITMSRAAYDALRLAGLKMSCMCFNYGQHAEMGDGTYTVDQWNLREMRKMQREWDGAANAARLSERRLRLRRPRGTPAPAAPPAVPSPGPAVAPAHRRASPRPASRPGRPSR